MRSSVDRITFASRALQYLTNVILNMLIVMGTFGILMFTVLYSS